jgi:hypothetical protein
LKKRPELLATCIWEPLKKYGIVLTPQEYAHHLLNNAPISEAEHTAYSDGVMRALSAILALDNRTKHLKVVFKDGTNTTLDLILDGTNLLINEKWLDFHESHEKAPCWLTQRGVTVENFPCDHIVTGLYDLILEEIRKDLLTANNTIQSANQSLRLRVSENLQQMPRMVEIAQGSEPEELIVNWTILERDIMLKLYGMDLECQVTLHRESTCSDKKMNNLFSTGESNISLLWSVMRNTTESPDFRLEDLNLEGSPAMEDSFTEYESTAECGCPSKMASPQDSGVVFQGLDPEEQYFPMVARNYDQAFFGVPPEAIRPSAPAGNDISSTAHSNSRASSRSSDSSRNEIHCSSNTEDNALSIANFVDGQSEKSSRSTTVSLNLTLGHCLQDANLNHGNDASQDSQASEDEAVCSTQEQQTRTKSRLLNSILGQLQSKEQQLRSTKHNLQLKEHELVSALEALESRELELRKAKVDNKTQKQRFENTIEDLGNEVRQLQETQSENDTQCTELSETIENLRAEVQQLREEKVGTETQIRQPLDADMSGAGQNTQGADERVEVREVVEKQMSTENQAGESVTGMRKQVRELQTQVHQARADQASIVTTLQGLSGMIQGVLSLGSRAMMVTTLQGVLGMIQGVLNLGVRMPIQLAGSKHARIKQEYDSEDDLANAPKRLRPAEHIDLTEQL